MNYFQANRLPSNISKSFTMIDIITKGSSQNSVTAGGFMAYMGADDILEGCYAAGNITATIDGDGRAFIGGLVGNVDEGEIKNCYALGNVVVNKSGGTGVFIDVGGLVGDNRNGKISNCFSAGMVNTQSAASTLNSGGIVGSFYGRFYLPGNIPIIKGKIENTAALGASVTVRSGIKGVGRIFGNNDDINATGTNNYALNTMAVEEGAYNSITLTPVALTKGLNDKDGEDASSSTFYNQAFWKTKLMFSVADWNFSRVAIEGYPRLAWELGNK
jgi:hypothetical protein